MKTTNEYDIFLSYARADYDREQPPSVRLLYKALERRGWSVFWDRKLKSGEDIRRVIEERIGQSGCVVVAWSKKSIYSDWVLEEADRGRKLSKLLPVMLERVDPPMPFGVYHANDLADWAGEAEHDQFALLVEAISEKVGNPEPPASLTTERDTVSPERPAGTLYPGVYVEEIPSSLRDIEAAGTSTAVFLGRTPRGDLAVPTFLTSLRDYEKMFGGKADAGRADPDGEAMRHAIRMFFENGGARAYVVRVAPKEAGGLVGAYSAALATIEKIQNANLLLLPGIFWTPGAPDTESQRADDPRSVILQAIEHCQRAGDRIMLTDLPPGLQLQTHADAERLDLPRSPYAALYYPCLWVAEGDEEIRAAPSAFAAGIWARTDSEHGVWKAPAGPGASLRGMSFRGPEYDVKDAVYKILNPLGINAIRRFKDPAPVLWGARTLAPPDEPQWRYINVRRTCILIKKSISENTQWVVFEPNHPDLWHALKGLIDDFMLKLWRSDAFPGRTPAEAWYVRCGLGETMTELDIQQGRLIIEVGVALIRPNEFTEIRIVHAISIA